MKKSLLALAVLAVATSATAATVYDKDGTSLKVGGRVQAIAYNGNFGKAGQKMRGGPGGRGPMGPPPGR